MALYTKHRPLEFDEMIGNESVVNSVSAVLSRKRKEIPHSWMFVGPSGCGKTTLARIIANTLGAHETEICEVNFANTKGVDTAREISRNMSYKPSVGKCRVWILDEFHEATSDAMNCLLKPMEDTPNHVYFILCTTNPQKIIPTIKTRCMTYELQSYTDEELMTLLTSVVEKENKSVHEKVLKIIARDSIGSARMALNVLDKIIDLPEEDQVKEAHTQSEQENEAIALCRVLIGGKSKPDWRSVADVIKNLKMDPEKVRQSVLGYASAVLLNSGAPRAYVVLECFNDNFYSTGRSGLVRACYMAVHG